MSIRIGITAGIGAGKSIACKVFGLLGVPVYDADSAAKWLMQNDIELKKQLLNHFGPQCFLPSGLLNRAWLAAQVFDSPDNLALLNSLVHPATEAHFEHWAQNLAAKTPYLLKEAALLFEAGSWQNLNLTILVYAPEPVRIARVLARDPNRGLSQIKDIISRQMPEEQKRGLANHILINDQSQMLIPQIIALHQKFLAL